MDERHKLEHTIEGLEAQLAELKARLPAHSIPPVMIAELDELDEALERARAKLAELEKT
jgi:BMFP domain-containing protein YqiC